MYVGYAGSIDPTYFTSAIYKPIKLAKNQRKNMSARFFKINAIFSKINQKKTHFRYLAKKNHLYHGSRERNTTERIIEKKTKKETARFKDEEPRFTSTP